MKSEELQNLTLVEESSYNNAEVPFAFPALTRVCHCAVSPVLSCCCFSDIQIVNGSFSPLLLVDFIQNWDLRRECKLSANLYTSTASLLRMLIPTPQIENSWHPYKYASR